MVKKICSSITTILVLFLILKISVATPSFFGLASQNNTHVFGKDSDVFSINITEANLNVSSVAHHIRVYEPGSDWYNTTSTCFNSSLSEWFCNNTVFGFGSLASDGKSFIYYYDAYDSSRTYNRSEYFFVVIDRSSPIIKFLNPLNATYVGGLVNVKIDVTDIYSGVNDSTVQYSFDNSVWSLANHTGNYYNATWNVSSLASNQNVTIYAKASDKLGNVNSTYINVSIDNEAPKIFVVQPTLNQILNGTAVLQVNVTDQYSGADNSSVYFNLSTILKSFDCSGAQDLSCAASLSSSSVADGLHTIYFHAKDKASNSAQNSTNVTVDNLPPSISIITPQKNSAVYGTIQINATVTDAGVGTDAVAYRWESSSKTGNWTRMDCTGNVTSYSCNASWGTRDVSDGNYVIRINATDKLGHYSESSVQFLINNFEHPATTTTITGSQTVTTTTTTQVSSGTATTTIPATTIPLIQRISDFVNKTLSFITSPTEIRRISENFPSIAFIILIVIIISICVLTVFFFKSIKRAQNKIKLN